MRDQLTIFAISDNRGGDDHRGKGKREPLVQIMISHHLLVQSVAFPPSQAPKIAEAILKAGRAAKRGRDSERDFFMDER